MTRAAILLLALWAATATAQVGSDGQWKQPRSIPEYCRDREQNIIAMYKTLIETNRTMTASETEQRRRADLLAYSNAAKDALKEYADEWAKLGCASILYPPPSQPPSSPRR